MNSKADQREFFKPYFTELSRRLSDVSSADLAAVRDALIRARDDGRKVMVAGNGASAAIASHVSVDLTNAAGIRSVNFNEADLITCLGNDYGYENWIAKAVEFYADAGDVLILVSGSGRSPNVLQAAACARERGVKIIALSGFDADNPLRSLGDVSLWVNSRNYNIIETTHQAWLVAVVDSIAGARTHADGGQFTRRGRENRRQPSG